MRDVDFFKMARATQDRFLACTAGRLSPAPLLAQPFVSRAPLSWVGSAGGALVVLAIVYAAGHGSLDSSLSRHPVPVVALYVGLLAFAIFAVSRALGLRRKVKGLPFKPGVYVFPMNLVDARTERFRVYPSTDLTAVSVAPGPTPAVQLTFAGASFVVPAASGEEASSAVVAVEAARARAPKALADEDANTLAELDPLYEPRFSSPVGPAKPLKAKTSLEARWGWVVAVAVAVVVGPVLWLSRNVSSDERMFATATTAGNAASYRAYLTHGERHREEVADVLLPRAELREAMATGTVSALRTYARAHPKAKIQVEIDAALRTAMLAELEKAKTAGTRKALVEFVQQNPDHGLDPEVRAAHHAVYVAALGRFKGKLPDRDKQVGPFAEKLFAYAEQKAGVPSAANASAPPPMVQVRFRQRTSKTIAKADAKVSQSQYFQGSASSPSHYFDSHYLQAREATFAQGVIAKLSTALGDEELLRMELGAALSDPDAPLPAVDLPTLFVEHGVEWTGFEIASKAPRGVLVGLNFVFEARFVLPSADPNAKPLTYKHDVWRTPNLELLKSDKAALPGRPPGGSPEEKVYEAMAKAAFDDFQSHLLGFFLKGGAKG